MNRFNVKNLPIDGLRLIEHKLLGDNRGYLSRLFCKNELHSAGWQQSVMQVNHTYTARKGAVRGMHFQRPPYCETKLVNCLRGEVWDVAIDLRVGSPSFLQWHAEILSAKNCRSLLIPEGFAHGFQALSDDVELLYLHSAPYMPEFEAGLNISDERIAINWPMQITDLSARDKQHPILDERFVGVKL